MSDSDVYLTSASSTESFDTSYLGNKEEMEVASTIQPYEGEPRLTKTVSRVRCSGQDQNKKLPWLNV